MYESYSTDADDEHVRNHEYDDNTDEDHSNKWHACPGSYKRCFVVVVLLCIDREGQKER